MYDPSADFNASLAPPNACEKEHNLDNGLTLSTYLYIYLSVCLSVYLSL